MSLQVRAARLRAQLYEEDEEYDLAAADYQVSVRLAEFAGDRDAEFRSRNALAGVLEKAGRQREAVRSASETLTRVRSWGDQVGVAAAHNNLGRVLLAKGDKAAAKEQYVAAINARADAAESSFGRAISYFGLGDTHEDDREFSDVMYVLAYDEARETADQLTALAYYLPRRRRPDGSFPDELLGSLRATIEYAEAEGHAGHYAMLAGLLADHLVAVGQRAEATGVRRQLLARRRGGTRSVRRHRRPGQARGNPRPHRGPGRRPGGVQPAVGGQDHARRAAAGGAGGAAS